MNYFLDLDGIGECEVDADYVPGESNYPDSPDVPEGFLIGEVKVVATGRVLDDTEYDAEALSDAILWEVK